MPGQAFMLGLHAGVGVGAGGERRLGLVIDHATKVPAAVSRGASGRRA